MSIEYRFNAYVEVDPETGCHLWTGPVKCAEGARPYGCMWVDGRNRYATSIAWFLEHNEWPDHWLGEQMCHTCDVTLCVRIDHLWKGDATENANDAFSKKRRVGMPGVSNPGAKLTDDQALDLIRRFNSGENRNKLAEEFAINRRTVYQIAQGDRRSYLRKYL